ncbi:hypothetical protein M404DRAFT_35996 [Pisolithus tinctorius Marx 270]|uniref:Uncharacterized protein n=1 Tax=Pisolithus tinctorius Marx 270 TaxID=870435 RepID=A0A0C3MXB1_PISTI|nr:hypothetical protein M404DRAFT_35996 [Pisolithus tinctorius Marx 270]
MTNQRGETGQQATTVDPNKGNDDDCEMADEAIARESSAKIKLELLSPISPSSNSNGTGELGPGRPSEVV